MMLKEFEAKEILDEYGISIPEGLLVKDMKEIIELEDKDFVVKAQTYSGGRKKAGLVRFADKDHVKEITSEMLGKAEEVLIEEKVAGKEIFISLAIDGAERNIALLFSETGGIDVEENKDTIKINFSEFDKEKIDLGEDILHIAEKLYKLMKEKDALLVEINPLIRTAENELVAADAKIILDDNAIYRHKEFEGKDGLSKIEKKAKEYGLQYVELGGDIAVIGNGAGLVMATLDTIKFFGGKPASFLDIGGGTGANVLEKALEVTLMKKLRGVYINIFAGITHCDEIAEGIVDFVNKNKIDVPLVIRMIGTNEKLGREILEKNNIHALDSLEEGAEKIVEVVK